MNGPCDHLVRIERGRFRCAKCRAEHIFLPEGPRWIERGKAKAA
jgi:hypothetical protein